MGWGKGKGLAGAGPALRVPDPWSRSCWLTGDSKQGLSDRNRKKAKRRALWPHGGQDWGKASLVVLQEADDPEHLCLHEAGSPLSA